MLDLTKEIQLEPYLRKKYIAAQVFLYIVFLAIVLFTSGSILFPSLFFVFDFDNTNSPKNTLNLSSTTIQSGTLSKGSAVANDILALDANPYGIFSKAVINLTTNGTPKNMENTSVTIRKSYEAFFYPTGSPIGFRNGTLLTADRSYYIVSNDVLRKFSNVDIVTRLGYSKNAFMQVSQDDLKYNKSGDDIADSTVYPDSTFFTVGDTYYQLKDQQLFPFASTRAFLSQFDADQAITKTDDFLSQYKLSETSLGFADGTLGSLAPSVFILSEGKSYPISNAETFVRMGFDWNNVIQLDSEEFGIYERQKQFTYNQPHPNGTLFMDQKTNKYFVIMNGEKHPVESAAIAKTYSKQKPVIADLEESETGVSCQLKKNWLSNNAYACTVSLDSLNNFVGNSFQIDAKFADKTKVVNVNTTFSTSLTWANLRSTLSRIKGNLVTNYTQP